MQKRREDVGVGARARQRGEMGLALALILVHGQRVVDADLDVHPDAAELGLDQLRDAVLPGVEHDHEPLAAPRPNAVRTDLPARRIQHFLGLCGIVAIEFRALVVAPRHGAQQRVRGAIGAVRLKRPIGHPRDEIPVDAPLHRLADRQIVGRRLRHVDRPVVRRSRREADDGPEPRIAGQPLKILRRHGGGHLQLATLQRAHAGRRLADDAEGHAVDVGGALVREQRWGPVVVRVAVEGHVIVGRPLDEPERSRPDRVAAEVLIADLTDAGR